MAASADNKLSSLLLVRSRTLRPAKSLRVSSARTGGSWPWGENLLPGKISQAKSRWSFISYHLSDERFGGSPAILGNSVTLEGVNYSITVNYVTTRSRNWNSICRGLSGSSVFPFEPFPGIKAAFHNQSEEGQCAFGPGKVSASSWNSCHGQIAAMASITKGATLEEARPIFSSDGRLERKARVQLD
jgi:hypothetical protein